MARFVAPDARSWTTHITYLTPEGNKAKVGTVRKFAPGPIPHGGAVRLAYTNGSTTLGVAEGIETALAASMLHDVPVWATLTAGNLSKFVPPSTIRNVIVFGDSDENFTGQTHAYVLASRLKAEGFSVEVRLPDVIGTDWNDHVDRAVNG
jgi:putative DNA primase/helicase